MKVTKELKTLISNHIWDRVNEENEKTRQAQEATIKRLNEEILSTPEYKARKEAMDAFSDMVARLAEENGVSTRYGRKTTHVTTPPERFFFEKFESRKVAEDEIARIITRIEYGTDYSDLSSVLSEYGIEL